MRFQVSFILSTLLASSSVFAAPTPFNEEQELEARFHISKEQVKSWASKAGKGLAQVAAFAAPIAIQAAVHHYSKSERDFPELTMEERDFPELTMEERDVPELFMEERDFPELYFEERDFPDFYMEERDFAELSELERRRVSQGVKNFFKHVGNGAIEVAKEVAPIAVDAVAHHYKW